MQLTDGFMMDFGRQRERAGVSLHKFNYFTFSVSLAAPIIKHLRVSTDLTCKILCTTVGENAKAQMLELSHLFAL